MVIVGLLVVLGFAVVPQTNAVTYNASVNVNTTYQTLEGFGASIAWYQSYLTAHPNREEVIDLLFRTWVSTPFRNQYNRDQVLPRISDLPWWTQGRPINNALLDSSGGFKQNGVLNGGL